jgi:hypothetical protein
MLVILLLYLCACTVTHIPCPPRHATPPLLLIGSRVAMAADPSALAQSEDATSSPGLSHEPTWDDTVGPPGEHESPAEMSFDEPSTNGGRRRAGADLSFDEQLAELKRLLGIARQARDEAARLLAQDRYTQSV